MFEAIAFSLSVHLSRLSTKPEHSLRMADSYWGEERDISVLKFAVNLLIFFIVWEHE